MTKQAMYTVLNFEFKIGKSVGMSGELAQTCLPAPGASEGGFIESSSTMSTSAFC